MYKKKRQNVRLNAVDHFGGYVLLFHCSLHGASLVNGKIIKSVMNEIKFYD